MSIRRDRIDRQEANMDSHLWVTFPYLHHSIHTDQGHIPVLPGSRDSALCYSSLTSCDIDTLGNDAGSRPNSDNTSRRSSLNPHKGMWHHMACSDGRMAGTDIDRLPVLPISAVSCDGGETRT